MGTYIHNAVAITSGVPDSVAKAYRKAQELGLSVTPIMKSEVNLYQTFFVTPHGRKVGTDDWVTAESKRERFREWLRDYIDEDNCPVVEWCEIRYGRDLEEDGAEVVADQEYPDTGSTKPHQRFIMDEMVRFLPEMEDPEIGRTIAKFIEENAAKIQKGDVSDLPELQQILKAELEKLGKGQGISDLIFGVVYY